MCSNAVKSLSGRQALLWLAPIAALSSSKDEISQENPIYFFLLIRYLRIL